MAQVKVNKKAIGAALALIIAFEGYSHFPVVPVPNDPLTVCRGHAHAENRYYSDAECDMLTKADLNPIILRISAEIPNAPAEITGAIADLCYNLGLHECLTSSSLKYAKVGNYKAACESLASKNIDEKGACHGYGCGWSHGKMYKGLQRRRQAERDLCMKGIK